MTELNGQTAKITSKGPHSFSINIDVSKFGKYEEGGLAAEQKQDSEISFKTLEESLKEPETAPPDFSETKFFHPTQIHLAMQAYHRFVEEKKREPNIWDELDAKEFISLAKKINPETEINEKLFTRFSYTCQGTLNPLVAFFGGILGQEVLKACSGKYSPLKQWLYLDGEEVIPDLEKAKIEDFLPKNNRSDGLRVVVGEETISKLANMRLFMIGCGAIGCELFKNFAMLGVATGSVGYLQCTDNDLIEKSNLNRQFLFRAKDLGVCFFFFHLFL